MVGPGASVRIGGSSSFSSKKLPHYLPPLLGWWKEAVPSFPPLLTEETHNIIFRSIQTTRKLVASREGEQIMIMPVLPAY